MSFPVTKLDMPQVIQQCFDEENQRLRTSAVVSPSGGFEIVINHEDDSIAIGTSTELFTSTTIGLAIGLDTNIINTVTVQGVDLDIRNLTFASDKVDASGSLMGVTGTVAVTQSGSWSVSVNNPISITGNVSLVEPITVDQGAAAALSGSWPVTLTDGTNSPTLKTLSASILGTDYAFVGQTVIHGLTTAGGGSYVPVKVNPSGALTVAASQDTSPWVVSGTVSANQAGTWTVQPGNTPNITPWLVSTKTALTAAAPTAATVGITSASAIAANAARRGLVIVNTSNNTVSFGLGATAVLNSGISLLPGATWVMDEYNYSQAQINAIASAVSSNISIQEFT